MMKSAPNLPAAHPPQRLLLVDDHAVMRAGLANMLNSRPEFVVVAQADNSDLALEHYKAHSPDIALLDVMMPGISGIECLRRIRDHDPAAKILMLSSTEMIAEIDEAIHAGASGFVSKTALPAELIAAIKTVLNGEQALDEDLKRRLEVESRQAHLTPRELEVLHLLRHGMSNPAIGNELRITARTAKAHVAAIMEKLEAQDRAEAVAKGFERGLLRP
ncbi:response regulator [Rubripirellula obstinata]|nr:response regulator transcription factor [Rubripirellula obstinata]